VLDANATVAVYDVKSRGEVLRFSRGFDRPDASGVATESIPIFFDWSPRGRILVGIARESSPGVRTAVQIRQADGGEKLASAMIEANARTTDAFFNPADPSQILVVATDLTIVDADTRATIRTIPIGQVIRHAEWRPDGAMILSVTDANLVQIWNAATGAAIRSTEGRGAAWSPDNSKLAVGRRNEVIIQSAGDGAQLEALPLLSDEQFAGPLAWRPSGTGIAGRGGSNMYIWPVH
jgi:WD40 repeat protein